MKNAGWLLLLLVGELGCARPSAPPKSVLHAPKAVAAIRTDGEATEADWAKAGRTGAFACEGVPVCAHAEARVLWSPATLNLSLYAADPDIRSQDTTTDGPVWLADHFRVVFRTDGAERIFELSPRGVVSDALRVGGGKANYRWNSGVVIAPDVDGTVNQEGDEDEEWALEVAIPIASLGLAGRVGESVELSVQHCDVPRAGRRVCSGFGDRSAPGLLIFD
jgi:hypothetical protein